jgi:hypothetical protein
MPAIFFVQAIFFLATGVWPLVHIKSFMKVTGPKHDLWLVKTVGVLVTAVAIGLFVSFYLEGISRGVAVIGMLSSLFLMGIDVFYTSIGRISRVYLIDAMVEILFVINALIFLISPNHS